MAFEYIDWISNDVEGTLPVIKLNQYTLNNLSSFIWSLK